METSGYLLIITLNVDGLNSTIKRNKVAEWIKIEIQLYTAYKRITSDLKIHTNLN